MSTDDTAPWADTTDVVGRPAAETRMDELKAGDGGDILCFGSLTTWNALLARGLVDELHVPIGPGAIGSGLSTFADRVDATH